MSDQYIPDDEPGDILSSLKELSQKTIPHAPTFKAAADTIEALRAENARLTEENENIKAANRYGNEWVDQASEEIARLRDALKPFADVAENDICDSLTDADIFRPMTREYSRAAMLTVGDLRNCKRILDGSTIE